jgi:hypothetical protein
VIDEFWNHQVRRAIAVYAIASGLLVVRYDLLRDTFDVATTRPSCSLIGIKLAREGSFDGKCDIMLCNTDRD